MSADAPYTLSYPSELPVSQARDELAAAIAGNQVVIVAGATGSGKTTQLPKICLELGRERIGHTQPRRIAARSIAERIAEELQVELGGVVGYQVRFDDRAKADTRIKLMTDGVLLAEINRDRELRAYDTLILDEAHERSLTIDFLLGYLKQLLPRRPDLKVIVTSATIDPESFARHFADASGMPAPIVEVSGRTFPVEIRYRPLAAEQSEDEEGEPSDDRDYLQGITDALAELAHEPAGDVLVFLTGENEIRDAEDAVRATAGSDTEVLPLYGRLSAADQHRVFEAPNSRVKRSPGIRRRIVLATNVAETSLTVPGIKYVVDAGTARISRYSARSKVQRLPIEAISQASANQRAGRAGRTSDGIAIRLYSEEDFAKRPEYTDPEILRTNLAAVILQMVSIGLGDIARFPFLQPPDSRGIQDGVDLLRELRAVEQKANEGGLRITRTGREMARLPVDPRFARMLVEAQRHGVTREVAAIVAGLSIQDVRERPLTKRPQADQAHARFADPTSDFLTLLNLWKHLEEKQAELSSSAFRRMCRAEFLNYLRVREWRDLYRQVLRAGSMKAISVKDTDSRGDVSAANSDAIHRSLLAGLLSRIGLRDDRTTKTTPVKGKKVSTDGQLGRRGSEYLGARNARFAIFPGSALAKKAPPAVMAAELVETSRLFARTVGAIDPAWAEQLAGDLVKRSYGEPRWEKKQGSAVADEKVMLYGVPIVPKRRIQLARIDPEQARELFIRHALVGVDGEPGDWPYETRGNTLFDFDRANRRLRRELEELEERTRRRDILVDDEAVVEFYDRVLPADITDVRRFETWWKSARTATPQLLTMTRETLLAETPSVELVETALAGVTDAYPTQWIQGDQSFRLSYRFEPGADDDGVTVEIPITLLPRVRTEGFDWLVPALREELVTALIKSLPKAIRKNVVPAADWARRLLGQISDGGNDNAQPAPLCQALADAIRTATHTPVSPADFDVDRLPPHLRMSFAAIDERGRRLHLAKDLAVLQAKLGERARVSVAKVTAASDPDRALERTGITAWDVEELPRLIETRVGGSTVRGFPAFVDEGATVSIRVFTTAAEQQREHRRGVRRLLAVTLPSPLSYVHEHLSSTEKLLLTASPYRSTAALLDDALLTVLDPYMATALPFTRAEFDRVRDTASSGLMDALFDTVGTVAKVMGGVRDADRAISAASSISLMGPLTDARAQLAALVYPGFVPATGITQLRRLPIYLAGISYRVGKLSENLGRDRAWQTEVEQATALYSDAGGTLPPARDAPPRLIEVRWMLEELRLSLFAQPLGAAGPVSVQRIRKALAE
ncbi:MAG TPA: ATP-dependent RNA helicase HrpA [Pseudolysinimonas sp.]|nr:ATP-dependent RNA helicase HrpA [Pseudolysinimonas sp.]